MSFFNKLFPPSDINHTEPEAEQAVIITLLTSDDFPDKDELIVIRTLEDKLENIITEKGVGDFDGDEFGEGGCSLYFYGKEADKILEAIKPELEKYSNKPIKVYLRYGAVDDEKAKEKTVVVN